LWSGKKDKIKRSVIVSEYENGGIKMPDIRAQIDALHASVITLLMDDLRGDWKLLPHLYLNSFGKHFLILNMHFRNKQNCPNMDHIPEYYKHVILSWHKAIGGNMLEPETPGEVRGHIIWGSKFIVSTQRRKKTTSLFYQKWIDSGIIRIDDLLDNNYHVNEKQILNKLIDKRDWLKELYILKKAIPQKWLTLLQTSDTSLVIENTDITNFSIYTCKYLYKLLITNNIEQPHSTKVWAEQLQKDPAICKVPWKDRTIGITTERKLSNFIFKFLHRILPNNKNLFKWKIKSRHFAKSVLN